MADESLTETNDGADKNQTTCWADMSDDEDIVLPAASAAAAPTQAGPPPSSGMLRAQQAGMLSQHKLGSGRGPRDARDRDRPASAYNKAFRGGDGGPARRMYPPLSRHQSTKSIDYQEDTGRPYKVCVSNLVPDVNKEHLIGLFRPMAVLAVEIMTQRQPHSVSAIVTLESFQDQRRALRDIDGKTLYGRNIGVGLLKPRDSPRQQPAAGFQSGLLAAPNKSQPLPAARIPAPAAPTQPASEPGLKPRRKFNFAVALSDNSSATMETEQRNTSIFGVGKPREEVLAEIDDTASKATDAAGESQAHSNPQLGLSADSTNVPHQMTPAEPASQAIEAAAYHDTGPPLLHQLVRGPPQHQSTPPQHAHLQEPESAREPVPVAKPQQATQQPQAPPQLQHQGALCQVPSPIPPPMVPVPKIASPPLLPEQPMAQHLSPSQSPIQLMQPQVVLQQPVQVIEGPPPSGPGMPPIPPEYYGQAAAGPRGIFNGVYWPLGTPGGMIPPQGPFIGRAQPGPPMGTFPYQGMYPQPGLPSFIPQAVDAMRGMEHQLLQGPPSNRNLVSMQNYQGFPAQNPWPPEPQMPSQQQMPPPMPQLMHLRQFPEIPGSEPLRTSHLPSHQAEVPPPPITSPAMSPAQLSVRSPVVAPSSPVAAQLAPPSAQPLAPPVPKMPGPTPNSGMPRAQQAQRQQAVPPDPHQCTLGAASAAIPPSRPAGPGEDNSGRRIRHLSYASVTKGAGAQPKIPSDGKNAAASGGKMANQEQQRGGQQRRGGNRWGRQASGGWQNNRKGSTGSNSRRRGTVDTTHASAAKPAVSRTNHSDSCSTDDFEAFAKINKRR